MLLVTNGVFYATREKVRHIPVQSQTAFGTRSLIQETLLITLWFSLPQISFFQQGELMHQLSVLPEIKFHIAVERLKKYLFLSLPGV
jgi:hypothetical protein